MCKPQASFCTAGKCGSRPVKSAPHTALPVCARRRPIPLFGRRAHSYHHRHESAGPVSAMLYWTLLNASERMAFICAASNVVKSLNPGIRMHQLGIPEIKRWPSRQIATLLRRSIPLLQCFGKPGLVRAEKTTMRMPYRAKWQALARRRRTQDIGARVRAANFIAPLAAQRQLKK
jgi:hypothetical protein